MPSSASTADTDAAFAHELNQLLVSTFHSIERYEERSLRAFDGLDLSVNEAHVIEAVGHGTSSDRQDVTVTSVAETLGVRVPTATAAVNRLVAKGLLVKERSTRDGRSLNVRLTRAGRRAFRLHELFHRRMVDAVAGTLTADERAVLAQGIRKLDAFFAAAPAGTIPAPASPSPSSSALQSVVVCKTANDAAPGAPVVHNGGDQPRAGCSRTRHDRED